MYAKKLLEHAMQLYAFAEKHRGKYSDSITDAKNFYPSSSDEDELVWGAAWLYGATKSEKYLKTAEKYYRNFRMNKEVWISGRNERVFFLLNETKHHSWKVLEFIKFTSVQTKGIKLTNKLFSLFRIARRYQLLMIGKLRIRTRLV